MKLLAVLALTLIVTWMPARANFSAATLEAISAAPLSDAALPVGLIFADESGRATTIAAALAGTPAVLIFADYSCHTLCGPVLDFAITGLAKTGLRPGADFRLVVIGLDPKDDLGVASTMRSAHLNVDDAIAGATVFLTGTDEAIRSATATLGYRYAYDAEHDQFAHPAAAYVVDATGRAVRVLSGLGLSGADLRLALVEAGRGAVGTVADRIRLLCYGYDTARGVYTERITSILEISTAATLLCMTGGIVGLLALERRRAAR